jgi:hypothetical protein
MGDSHKEKDPDAEGRRAKLRRMNRVGCLLLVVIVLVPLLLHYLSLAPEAERELEAEMARLTEAGILLSPEDLIPEVPEGELNAADLYQQAFGAVQMTADERTIVYDLESDRAARLATLRELISRNPGYFDLIERASRLPHCAFPVDWSDPFARGRYHGPQLREVTRWLRRRMEVRAADGNWDGVLQDAGRILRIGEHLKLEPAVLSAATGSALQRIGLSQLGEVLDEAEPSVPACRKLYDQLDQIDHVPASVRGLKGELALYDMPIFEEIPADVASRGVLSFRRLMPDETLADELAIRSYGSVGKHLLYRDKLATLRRMEKTILAASMPWPECRQQMAEARRVPYEMPSRHSVLTRSQDVSIPASVFADLDPGRARAPSDVRSVHTQFLLQRDERASELRLMQVALAAVAYRVERGQYPDSLAELEAAGWDTPLDPFSRQPLRYRREGDGFVVWGLGPNLKDDNGVEYDPQTMVYLEGPYDIVLRCASGD